MVEVVGGGLSLHKFSVILGLMIVKFPSPLFLDTVYLSLFLVLAVLVFEVHR